MLELSVADGDSCPVITLSGQADLTTAARLSELITAQLSHGMARLVIGASELSSADSTAIRALVLAALTLKDRGGGLVLRRPRQLLVRMLAPAGAGIEIVKRQPQAVGVMVRPVQFHGRRSRARA